MAKTKGIAEAAREARVSEGALRRLERRGVVNPSRDPWGRRLFGEDDIAAARAASAKSAANHRIRRSA